MPRGFYTYESFFSAADTWDAGAIHASDSFGTAYSFTVPGKLMGLRTYASAVGAVSATGWYGYLKYTSTWGITNIRGARAMRQGHVYTGPFPGFAPYYFDHFLQLAAGEIVLLWVGRAYYVYQSTSVAGGNGVDINRGHVNLKGYSAAPLHYTSTRGTTMAEPVAINPSGQFSVASIDPLFLPD